MNARDWTAGPTAFRPSDLSRTWSGRGFAMPLDRAWPAGRPTVAPSGPRPVDPALPTVVVGGAGALGVRLVAELLRSPERGPVVVASRRPAALLPALAALTPGLERDPRIVLAAADALSPDFAGAVRDALRGAGADGRIGVVHDLAARVDALAPASRLAVNAVAPLSAMSLAAAQRPGSPPPRLVHASTLSVVACADGLDGTVEDWLPADPAISIRGGYAATKAIAEGHVAHHLAFGASAVCVRLGLLVPDDGVGADASSFLHRFASSLAALGTIPDEAEEALVDMTPFGHAARALAAIGDSDADGVLHYACPETLTLTSAVRAIAERRPLRVVGAADWLASLSALPSLDAAILEAAFDRSGFLRRRCTDRPLLNADLFQSTGRTWTQARAVDAGAPATPPAKGTFRRVLAEVLP